jgi:hypothetical protein
MGLAFGFQNLQKDRLSAPPNRPLIEPPVTLQFSYDALAEKLT